MKGIAVIDKCKTQIIEMDKPVPKENEVLIRIKASAICTWEQRVFVLEKNVPLPYVGGHEIAGIIEEIGSNVPSDIFKIGAHCTGRVQKYCGTC